MKKQIIILFLLIFQLSSWSQGKTIKTEIPCSDEVLIKTPGRWNKYADVWQTDHIAFNSSQQKEVSNRIDKIQAMMQNIYPKPIGVDVAWRRSLGYGRFAEQVRYELNTEGSAVPVVLKEKPVAGFDFTCGFFRHFCSNNPYEIWSGYPGETGTWVFVYANSYRQATAAAEQISEGTLTINGYLIRLRQRLHKRHVEFELLGVKEVEFTTNYRYLIVHRKGMLPYIPVTRKQYLEQCIPYLTQQFANWIKDIDKMHSATEDERAYRDEGKKKTIEQRDVILKRYKDELEKTTRQGLLDMPAIVKSIADQYDESIFFDETEGWMLVIDNPEYIRKDLPKHVPQFFTVVWRWNDWPPQKQIAKLMEEKFPFGNLLEMIDK